MMMFAEQSRGFVGITVGVRYAELCCERCSKVVNDQMELRIIDVGDPGNGSQNKMDSGRLIKCLKRGIK